MLARIDSSKPWTMGCRCGIWRRNQSSMSEWFADGSGGFRRAFPLISFGIATPPPHERRRMMRHDVRFHLLLIAYLHYRSSFVPKLLTVLLAIAGLGYLFDSFGRAAG